MKRAVCLLSAILLMAACHESLEQRAAREAQEYTERYCPTPVINNTRTDSVKFEIDKKNYVYYCSFVGQWDDAELIRRFRNDISRGISSEIRSNTGMKRYVEAGYTFTYIVRSDKNPELVLFQDTIKVGPGN